MTRRILAIAWKDDQDELAGCDAIKMDCDGDDDFDVSGWAFKTDQTRSIYISDYDDHDLVALLSDFLPTIVMVLHSSGGAGSPRFVSALHQIAGWGYMNKKIPAFVFVRASAVSLDKSYHGSFRGEKRTETRLTNDATPSRRHANRVEAIREFQQHIAGLNGDPWFPAQVGLGVFLISEETGEVHLSERISSSSMQNVGTIGGNIQEHQSIDDTLRKLVEDRLSDPEDFRLGSLLACTNMKHRQDNKLHYVDLTFLATISNKPKWLRSSKHRPIGGERGPIWFSFCDVADLSKQQRLFPPVENAYRALSRIIAGHIVGHQKSFPVLTFQLLNDPALKVLVDNFDESQIPCLLESGTFTLPRLSGFLFEQSMPK